MGKCKLRRPRLVKCCRKLWFPTCIKATSVSNQLILQNDLLFDRFSCFRVISWKVWPAHLKKNDRKPSRPEESPQTKPSSSATVIKLEDHEDEGHGPTVVDLNEAMVSIERKIAYPICFEVIPLKKMRKYLIQSSFLSILQNVRFLPFFHESRVLPREIWWKSSRIMSILFWMVSLSILQPIPSSPLPIISMVTSNETG